MPFLLPFDGVGVHLALKGAELIIFISNSSSEQACSFPHFRISNCWSSLFSVS